MSWRFPLLALCLLLTLFQPPRPALAQAASPDRVSGELLYSISLEEMDQLLREVGFIVIDRPEALRWILRSAGGHTLVMTFAGCKEARCEGVRLRAVWPLGSRPQALAAVKSYESSVAIAHVNLMQGRQGAFVMVGRDIWMLPGRTAANVAAQLRHTEVLADSMTQHLTAQDPGIAAFWNQAMPQ